MFVLIFYNWDDDCDSLSKRMRDAGEKSSSNWPVFTPHKNAARNNPATDILAKRRMTITAIAENKFL